MFVLPRSSGHRFGRGGEPRAGDLVMGGRKQVYQLWLKPKLGWLGRIERGPGGSVSMTQDEAESLLVLARQAQLVGAEAPNWIERLTPKRQEIVEAVGWLAGNGEEMAAAELAAAVWRLWLLSGDVAGGRQMLAAALALDHPKPSHGRALARYADGELAFREGARAAPRARTD